MSFGTNHSIHKIWCKLYNSCNYDSSNMCRPTTSFAAEAFHFVQIRIYYLDPISPPTEYDVTSTTVLIWLTAETVEPAGAFVSQASLIVLRVEPHLVLFTPVTKYDVSFTTMLIKSTAKNVQSTDTIVKKASNWLWRKGKFVVELTIQVI